VACSTTTDSDVTGTFLSSELDDESDTDSNKPVASFK